MRNAKNADSVELKDLCGKAYVTLPYLTSLTGRRTEQCRHEDDQFSGTVLTARLSASCLPPQHCISLQPHHHRHFLSKGPHSRQHQSYYPLPILRRPSYPCGRIPWGISITTSLCSYNLYANKYTFQFALAFS